MSGTPLDDLSEWIDTRAEPDTTPEETTDTEPETNKYELVTGVTKPLNELVNAGMPTGKVVEAWLDYVVGGLSGEPDRQQAAVDTLDPVTSNQNTGGEQQTLTSHAASNDASWTRERLDEATTEFITASHTAREDVMSRVFQAMDIVDTDVLAQNFTPSAIAEFIVNSSVNDNALVEYDGEPVKRPVVAGDPSCGAGMFLTHLGYKFREHEPAPPVWVIGQDIDPTAAKASAINMVVHGVPGFVITGDTLRNESNTVWRIGNNVTPDPSPAYLMELPASVLPDGFGSLNENTTAFENARDTSWDGELPDMVGDINYDEIPVSDRLFDAQEQLDPNADLVLDV